MKKLLILILSLIFLCLLSSCSDSPSIAQYSFADTEGGVILQSVNVRSRQLDLPESYRGKPVVAIADNAFYRSEDLRKVRIPSSVKTVGVSAFADCEKLNTVVFEAGGSCTLSDDAFSGCLLLNKLDFNGSVVSVGERAFMNCKRIKKLEIGSEVTEIGIDAFMGCEQMLFIAEKGSYAAEYAEKNHLITNFFETETFLYIEIVCAVLLCIGGLAGWKILSKKRKKITKIT